MWTLRLAVSLAGLAAASLVACSATAAGGPPPKAPDDLDGALERAIAAPGETALRLWTRSWIDDGFQSVELFGNGVGIWNGAKAFELTPEELAALLARLEAVGLAAMPEVVGGRPEPEGRRRLGAGDGGASGPVRIVRELVLEVDGLEKRVEQRSEGEQSASLEELVLGLLEATRERGEAGRGAADIDAGLAAIAAGELPVECLVARLHDKPELRAAESAGLLLELDGRRLEVRDFIAGSGYGEPRRYELAVSDVRRLAAELARQRPGRVPANVYSGRYVQVTIEVLDQRMSTQARAFAGIDAGTHGAAQTAFDALRAELRELYRAEPERGPAREGAG